MVDAAVMLIFKLVCRRAGCWVSLLPEGFDEKLSFLIRQKLKENFLFLGRDDVDDLLFQPFLVSFGKFRGRDPSLNGDQTHDKNEKRGRGRR